MASLWMGDLDSDMPEDFIIRAFAAFGEKVLGVTIIRNRVTGLPTGYGFVEFPDRESADKCLKKLNRKLIPGCTLFKIFKLRHAFSRTYTGKAPESSPAVQGQKEDYTQADNSKNQTYQQMCANSKSNQKTDHYPQYDYTQSSYQTYEDLGETALEDPMLECDVGKANKQFMQQSEELYDALMGCHWQPLDTATSTIPF
ncbi:tRNA selenocysteine 1-associated protein 1-like isoform 2-T2 [Discoglossus pictus]